MWSDSDDDGHLVWGTRMKPLKKGREREQGTASTQSGTWMISPNSFNIGSSGVSSSVSRS